MPKFNNSTAFQEVLLQRRRAMGAANRKRSQNPKKQAWIYPYNIERKYWKEIKAWMAPLVEQANLILMSSLPGWVLEYNLSTERIDSIRMDEFAEELTASMDELKVIAEKAAEENLKPMIVDVGYDVSDQNAKQWSKFTEGLLGVKLFPHEAWESEVIKVWGQNNYNLITSLTDEYIKKVNLLVSEGVQTSASAKTYEDAIKEMLQQSKKLGKDMLNNRAKLIARDQVGKLSEQFTQRRQQDAGIDMYIWATVGDERVRKNHKVMNGKVCRWDDSTVYSDDNGKTWKSRSSIGGVQLPPGQAIQCRCTAIPFFSDLIEEVDEIINSEKAA